MTGFLYLIKSSRIVQMILAKNEEILRKKLEETKLKTNNNG